MDAIYIALPITGREYNDVVKEIINKKMELEGCGYKVYHPMTGKSYLRTEKNLKAHGYDDFPSSTNHAIFERDKFMVKKSDIVFVDFTHCTTHATGMTMELAWASMLGRHTIIVLPEDSPFEHAFILEAADIVFRDTDSAMAYLRKLACGDI